MPNAPSMGNADRAANVNHRASPADQGLTRSESPIQQPVTGALASVVDQAIAGSPNAEAQLNALLASPGAVQALTQQVDRPTRATTDAGGRSARESASTLPSIEQIQALDRATRVPEVSLEQYMAQLQGQVPQQPQVPAPQLPPVPPMGVPQAQFPGFNPLPQLPPAPPAPAAQQPEWMQAVNSLVEANRQQADLVTRLIEAQQPQQQAQQPMTQRERLVAARDELVRQGVQNITADTVVNYLNYMENQELRQRLYQVEQRGEERWQDLSAHAQNIRLSQEIDQRVTSTLAPFSARVTPQLQSFVAGHTRMQVQQGVPLEQAIGSAMAALAPLLQAQQLQQTPQNAAPLMAPPPAPPPYQVPAYQGMNPFQVFQQQQAMAAAAVPGNGANRYGPSAGPSLEALDGLFLALGHN